MDLRVFHNWQSETLSQIRSVRLQHFHRSVFGAARLPHWEEKLLVVVWLISLNLLLSMSQKITSGRLQRTLIGCHWEQEFLWQWPSCLCYYSFPLFFLPWSCLIYVHLVLHLLFLLIWFIMRLTFWSWYFAYGIWYLPCITENLHLAHLQYLQERLVLLKDC